MRHVTIIDNNTETLKLYKEILSNHFKLTLIDNLNNVFDFIQTSPTELIITDVHLTEISGLDFLKQLKSVNSKIPVIFLTNDPSEELLTKGLALGASDYIIKPVSLNELVARINNKMNFNSLNVNEENTISMKDFTLHCNMQCAEINENKVQLTPIEFKFLHLLAKNPNKIYSREYISKMLWPDVHVQNQNIDTHLSNLRKKLVPFSQKIKTIKSRGYILRI